MVEWSPVRRSTCVGFILAQKYSTRAETSVSNKNVQYYKVTVSVTAVKSFIVEADGLTLVSACVFILCCLHVASMLQNLFSFITDAEAK
jgi:hypothetical protein